MIIIFNNDLDIAKYIIGPNTPIETTQGLIPRTYFNNSATTLILKPVIDKFLNLLPIYTYIDLPTSNSNKITSMYEETRSIVLDFIGGDIAKDLVIYTKNATDSINILSNIFYQDDPDQVVLSTTMEHLANYLPYKERMKTDLICIGADGNIDLNDYENKLKRYKGKVKLVAVTGASNITGVVPKYKEMARLAHKYNAKIFVDIVQVVQHLPFSMNSFYSEDHIDFVAFSAHKAYTGLDGGVLVGPKDFIQKFLPLNFGSGITKFIDSDRVIYKEAPGKYEAGYPEELEIICMSEAIKFLQDIQMSNIRDYERKLYEYLVAEMRKIDDVYIYAYQSPFVDIPYVSFNVIGIDFKTVASKLGYDYAIEVGNGRLGADLYVQYLLGLSNEEALEAYLSGKDYGVIRISMGMYNTFREIDTFICALKNIVCEK